MTNELTVIERAQVALQTAEHEKRLFALAEKAAAEAKIRAAERAEAGRVAQEQAARDASLRAESERLDAERREVARQQAELDDGATILRKFVERFGKRREFAAVVRAINEYLKVAA